MLTLVVSCLTTSSLPWFMDLTFQVPCNIALKALDLASITSHIHNWVLFLLWLHLFILSGVISPLFPICSILGTYQPGKFIFQCPIFLPFHSVHGVLKARISSSYVPKLRSCMFEGAYCKAPNQGIWTSAITYVKNALGIEIRNPSSSPKSAANTNICVSE